MEFLPLTKDGVKVYSGFSDRVLAALIDAIVLIPIIVFLQFIQGLAMPVAMLSILLSGILFSAFSVFFHYRFGATPGKMFLKIKVTNPNGSSISLKQAVLRSSVNIFFAVLIVAAGIMALSHVNSANYLSIG